jgi:hypothetical protein
MKRFLLVVFVSGLSFFHAQSQRVIEVGIKPTEAAFLNFEANAAIGNQKTRYGIFLSYRPGTQSSGEVKSAGSGSAGGYGQPHYNKLYTSYTVGLYQKTYFKKNRSNYFEADVFYRNWSFKNKQAFFNNVEGYRFDGTRTENVDVYGLKLLLGHTVFLSPKENKCRFYLDIYGGLGIRYKQETYETVDGYIYDEYYAYKKDKFNSTPIGVQGGVKFGILIAR